MKILIKVGDFEPIFLTSTTKKKAAEMVKNFEKIDRYEIETLKYEMPKHWNGKYPEYIITK